MNPEIEKLAAIAAESEIITERQREIIRNKAIALGEDPEEAELFLDLLLRKKIASKENTREARKYIAKENAGSIPITQVEYIIPEQAAPQEKSCSKNRLMAAFLAILLGAFGVHYFYLGHIGKGIVCFLFSWTFIPAFLGIVSGCKYLLQSDKAFRDSLIK